MGGTLIVTNDFGPRIGGIESFVTEVASRLPGRVVVLTADQDGAAAHDRRLGHEVVRCRQPTLLPTSRLRRQVAEVLASEGLDRVLFGAAAPLGLLADAVRRAGATRVVALSHGHEVWWAALPGSRALLRRIVRGCDRVGTISSFTRRRIAAALPPPLRSRLVPIPPPVDVERFRPGPAPTRPTLLAAGRLRSQKGFPVLLDAWRLALPRLPDGAVLRIAGTGPLQSALWRQASGLPVEFVGSVPHRSMPDFLRCGTAFALPVRTRLAGLNPEGLGLVFAEAAACGLPVLAGDSGGTRDVVLDGRSGHVLAADDVDGWADRIVDVLTDPALVTRLGAQGRRHVQQRFAADRVAHDVAQALDLDAR